MRALINQKYPTHDGIQLAADVYMPDGPGPHPVILTRTPYNRVGHLAHNAKVFVPRGYAYVATDCRGRFESEGSFDRMFDEVKDGQATIDWIANQKWCNGRIGMFGRSYGGVFQIPAAIGGHEAIKCINPTIVCGRMFENWSRYDGCFALQNPLWWVMGHGTGRTAPSNVHVDLNKLMTMRTLDEVEDAIGFGLPILRDIVANDQDGPYWDKIDQWPMHEKIRVPGLHGGGWFDHVSMGQFEGYERIRDHGATAAAREGQRLWCGPWGHITFFKEGDEHRKYGDWDFGDAALASTVQHELRFFDLHLKDIDDGIGSEPPVRIFLMGENRWLDLADWPPPCDMQDWHLDSSGNAHGTRGDGALTRDKPSTTASDRIVHDPDDPVPTWGGQIFWGMPHKGPLDQRWLLERDDVLFYQSPKLDKPLCVIGNVSLDVTLATDVEDTDIVAKLCVVMPDRSVMSLIVGSFRWRYREGWDKRVPMVKGEPATINMRLSQLAYTFPVGSRVGLMLSSSCYPRIQPHSGTMALPWSDGPRHIANNDVIHGGDVKCALKLPVVDLD